MRTRTFLDQVYRVKFVVVIFKGEKERVRLSEKYGPLNADHGACTFFHKADDKQPEVMTIIFNREVLPSRSHILRYAVHESFHASTMVLLRAGTPLEDSTQESYAYYNEFVFIKVLDIITGK